MKSALIYAVGAQRFSPAEGVDSFPTPPWATRALTKFVIKPSGKVWEPACGAGHMSRALAESFGAKNVFSTDILDYNWKGQDALFDWVGGEHASARGFTWMITNPPFRHAETFVKNALIREIPNVAVLVRTQFLEGVGRFNNLYSWRSPAVVAQFAERVPMVQGRLDPKASTATSYAWVVWVEGVNKTRMMWIPPCRALLEKDEDYTVP